MKTTARKKVSLAFLLACWCLVFAQLGIVKSQDLFEEFNEGQFDSSKWDFIDPLQDCSYAVNDGYLEINVPAGQSHNMWNPNNAPRLVRTLPDVDFGLEVKFDSEPVEKYQSQGLIVQQDQNNYIRYDIYSDGSNLRLFAAVHDNGSWSTKLNKIVPKGGPYYLLVGRQGDSWSFSLSYNGLDYTEHLSLSHSMAVTSGGVFGFNHGTGSNNAPAFKARADYFYFTQTTSDDSYFIDEFNTLNEDIWTVVDPLDDSSIWVSDGRLHIEVASGQSHDIWIVNDAPRIIKSAGDNDFFVEAKFDSTPTKQYQMQGILAEESQGNYIRHEVHYDGANLKVYGAKFINGNPTVLVNRTISRTAPFYLAISRTANQWDLLISSDGNSYETVTTFQQSYSITSTGLYGGNYGTSNNAPAFIAIADYFLQEVYDNDPPTETFALTTSVSGSGTVSRSPNKSAYDKGEQVTLTASAAQGWKFSSWSGDASGSQNPLTITVDKNLNVTAVFEPIEQEGKFFDEFNTFNTNVWAFVNPLGDSSAGTANGRLYIDVAGGASHHPWTINEAPRVMKSIPNGDFYIEAQFVSTPSKGYQMQGLQAEQGPGNYIRYELYHDGTNLRVYAAKFVNGSAHTMLNKPISLSPPYVLSIYRQGNSWQMGLSSENTTQETVVSFNQSYTINSVGMHAGNYDTGNNAPAFTALMEYFYQDTFGEPPAEKYNLNVSVSGEGTVSRSPNKSEYDKGEQVTLTASAAQGWKFSSWSGDASGSQNPLTITVDKNLNVTAVFEPIEQEGKFFDEFNTFNTNVWAFVNPLGDSSVSVDNGKLHINVAGGANHDAWIENDAPRIMKSVANTDFRIETRFDSEPNEQYQMQGLIAEQSNSNYVRYELHNDGNGLRIYAAHFVNGVVSVQLSQRTNYKPPYYMSIVREGSTWNLRLSGDGISWNTVKTFDHSYNIQQVGLYGGNYRADGNPPAFQAIADHFLYEQLEGSPGQYTLDISKRGEGQVSVSPAGPYDFGDIVQLSATPASGWIFIGWAGDIMTTSNPSTITITKSHNVTAIFEKASEPTFNIWYGREQDFVIGNPQRWINVLGNVTNPGQISNLTFSLNEGAENRLSMGPDENIRLALPGDFNAEISISSLSQGVNYVRFTATNTSGQQARYTVVVNYAGRNKRWPIPYTIKWSEVDNIQDVAQVTDGRWVVDSNGLHTTNAWYDRLVAIGDIEWSDYEITGSFIVHQHYYTVGQPGNQPLVGFLLRWTGHFNWYGEQPNEGWWPFGAIGGFRWLDHTTRGYWRIVGNQNKVIAQESTQSNLELGKRYMMKMQVQSVKNQGSYYRFKRWTAGQPEPQQWQLVAQEKITDPQKGSILLLAHHVDVTFGDVTVVPLNPIQ